MDSFMDRYGIVFNEQQRAAVQAVSGPVLLLAVPGSGKTTVLISRLGYMILENGICPGDILTVTYTVAAAGDMKKRFQDFFGDVISGQPEFRTINGFSQKVLMYYAKSRGKVPFSLAENERNQIISFVFRQVTGDFAAPGDVETAGTEITFVKNMRLSEEQIRCMECETESFPEIFKAYNQVLRERKLMDYDDQVVSALKILESCPDVLSYFRGKYKYLCVDEAQDTSKIQHDIIRLLAGNEGSLFMVGDEDQSIYGFRAAYPEALTAFENQFKNARVLLMETNYRSCPEIVSAADRLICANKNRHEKHMNAASGKKGIVKEIRLKSRKVQYQYLLKALERCEKETAVLYRNNESALPLVDLMDRKGMSFQLRKTDYAFFSSPVVRDILDFITFGEDPLNEEVFMRIYYKMDAGISRTMAENVIQDKSSVQPFLSRIADNEQVSPWLRQRCRELALHFSDINSDSAVGAVNRILNSMGYKKYIRSKGLDYGKAETLRFLSEKIDKPQQLRERLAYLEKLFRSDKDNKESKIILSTIHSSKGLEYERVFMIDMIEGILPSERKKTDSFSSASDTVHCEEERRLYYVAMTRAKRELYIFTFSNESTSRFSKEVFGNTAAPKKLIEDGLCSGGKYSLKSSMDLREIPAISQEQIKILEEKIKPGMEVVHSRFGKGRVLSTDGKIAQILFEEKNEIKKIALNLALRNKMLTPVV